MSKSKKLDSKLQKGALNAGPFSDGLDKIDLLIAMKISLRDKGFLEVENMKTGHAALYNKNTKVLITLDVIDNDTKILVEKNATDRYVWTLDEFKENLENLIKGNHN